jgi:hypothetical protein
MFYNDENEFTINGDSPQVGDILKVKKISEGSLSKSVLIANSSGLFSYSSNKDEHVCIITDVNVRECSGSFINYVAKDIETMEVVPLKSYFFDEKKLLYKL